MAWTGVWSYDVDGTELNDGTNYITMIPELDNLTPRNIVMAEIDGDHPVFIRSQPQAGTLTFLIALAGGVASATAWQTGKEALRTLFDQSAYHTLTAQVRGMSTTKSLAFVVEGMQFDYKTKTAVVNAVAPNPNLT